MTSWPVRSITLPASPPLGQGQLPQVEGRTFVSISPWRALVVVLDPAAFSNRRIGLRPPQARDGLAHHDSPGVRRGAMRLACQPLRQAGWKVRPAIARRRVRLV